MWRAPGARQQLRQFGTIRSGTEVGNFNQARIAATIALRTCVRENTRLSQGSGLILAGFLFVLAYYAGQVALAAPG